MIYDSLDIIPLKLFLKILDNGNYTLLTDEKERLSDCKAIWRSMEDEHYKLGYEGNIAKILDITVRIEALKYKYDCVMAAVQSLKFDRNIDLENMLRDLRYAMRPGHHMEDLERIENEVKSINIKIKRLEMRLPKKDDENKNLTTIDRVILGYCSITGLSFDTNKISYTQFYALKSTAEDKMKAVEQANTRIKNKGKHGRRNNHP